MAVLRPNPVPLFGPKEAPLFLPVVGHLATADVPRRSPSFGGLLLARVLLGARVVSARGCLGRGGLQPVVETGKGIMPYPGHAGKSGIHARRPTRTGVRGGLRRLPVPGGAFCALGPHSGQQRFGAVRRHALVH